MPLITPHIPTPELLHGVDDPELDPLRALLDKYALSATERHDLPGTKVVDFTLLGDSDRATPDEYYLKFPSRKELFVAFGHLMTDKGKEWLDEPGEGFYGLRFTGVLSDIPKGQIQGIPGAHRDRFGRNVRIVSHSNKDHPTDFFELVAGDLPGELREAYEDALRKDVARFQLDANPDDMNYHPELDDFVSTAIAARAIKYWRADPANCAVGSTERHLHRVSRNMTGHDIKGRLFSRVVKVYTGSPDINFIE